MNERVALSECAEICEELRRQMENDCQIPPHSLGGKMRPAYERVRREDLAVMKEVGNRVRMLLETATRQ